MGRIKPQALLQQSKRKKGVASSRVPVIVICNLVILIIMLSLLAMYRLRNNRASNSLIGGLKNNEEIGIFEDIQRTGSPVHAILNTTKGMLTIELFTKSTAGTVSQFLERSQHGYFNGLQFYRVIKHFVIQAGNPNLPSDRDEWTNGEGLHTELESSPKHEAFIVGTSKSGSLKEGFELYITTAPIPDLNAKMAVFGRVIKGTDVVQEIEDIDTDEHFRPKSPVIINGVSFKDDL